MDPQPRPEGSYEIGSVRLSIFPSGRPSFNLSVSFLRIGSLVFSKPLHGVRGPCHVVLDIVGFFLKKLFAPKIRKMGQKCNENRVFKIYWKIWSLIFCEFLWIFWFLRYGQKSSLPIRLQYFKIDFISRTKWWKSLIFCLLIQIHRN